MKNKKIPFAMPIIGDAEQAAVAEVLSGPILVHGPRATQFENDFANYIGAPHAVTVSSCTAGMHLIWFTLGVGPGDEIIVPALTHTATAHAVELTGARAIFVDCDPLTGNVTSEAIGRAISPRTKGIAVVHFLGLPVDMAPIIKLAKRNNLFVLEDCALAVGTKLDGLHAGLHGDAGVFSFYPVKHMTTAEGGMIVMRDPDLASKLKLRKAFGVDRSHAERKISGFYDVVALGYNYRMNEIQAAIGSAQIKRLDGFLSIRNRNYSLLADRFAGLDNIELLDPGGGRFQHSWYCLSIILSGPLASKRSEIVNEINSEGVGTSVYYPQPVPRMKYYKEKYGYIESAYKNAEKISDHSIALPVGPHLSIEDINFVAEVVNRSLEKVA